MNETILAIVCLYALGISAFAAYLVAKLNEKEETIKNLTICRKRLKDATTVDESS